MSKLVIVESPTKAKTLSKILTKDYIVESSRGHVRDLPKKGLAVDVEKNFKPEYIVPEKAKKVVTKLKKCLPEVDSVVLATDPDREGEAIAWHLRHILTSVKKYKNMPYERVVFHELTKDAVLEAFEHPGALNEALVDSQQARRVLDRLVGYKLSPLLWKKVRFGLSAGRVQSVAVRLIVEKERERDAFKSEEYWSMGATFVDESDKAKLLEAELNKKDGEKIEIKNERSAKEIKKELRNDVFKIGEVKKSERKKKPNAPFKTSTLQQVMANNFGFAARKTMSAAQKLFEQGLITYHRTDSLSLSPAFVKDVREFIKKDFGAEFLPTKAVEYKTKSKNAQEAHEAIRVTDVSVTPVSKALSKLKEEELKVYSMIWLRSIECQMVEAIYDQTAVLVDSNSGYQFRANGSVLKFEGWLAAGTKYFSGDSQNGLKVLPEFTQGDKVGLEKLEPAQHFTQPPARYSDASLIKRLEELGIGRPSTYAPTLTTIQRRGYVKKDTRYFVPQDVAFVVTDLLVEHFPTVTGYEFTAGMEDKFDDIANGKTEWVPVIRDFYTPFEKTLEEKDKILNKHDVTNLGPANEKCPDCGRDMVFKLGKYGKFISCTGYPECEFAKPTEENIVRDEDGNEITDFGRCPNCEDGKFMLKTGRFGKFLACNNYPKCKTTEPYLEKIGMNCPICGDGEVVVKKARGRVFYGCSKYPECNYSSWKDPRLEKKEEAKVEA